MRWGNVHDDMRIGFMWVGIGGFSFVSCCWCHSGELNKEKNHLSGRNFCSSTAFFVFTGNGIPVEVEWFPLNFWKYGYYSKNRKCDFCHTRLCDDFHWHTGKKNGGKLYPSMVCGGICKICFQTWSDVFMCGLCSHLLCAKNLLVWGRNFSVFIFGFCPWSGLWILAGNQGMAENTHCNRMRLDHCGSLSLVCLKKHHEISWCNGKLLVLITSIECHKSTEQHCPSPKTMLFHHVHLFSFHELIKAN